MTKTNTTPATAADPNVAAASAQFLTPVVLGLQALAVNGKQAHWNVRGANFIAIHELLDAVVANAQAGADQAAERIVALGLPIDARVGTVAAKTTTPDGCSGTRRWPKSARSPAVTVTSSSRRGGSSATGPADAAELADAADVAVVATARRPRALSRQSMTSSSEVWEKSA